MIKKIVAVPVKIVKGTYKAASWAYKLASGALLGAAIYRGIQKALESRRVPEVPDELPPVPELRPETPKPKSGRKPAGKRKAKKK